MKAKTQAIIDRAQRLTVDEINALTSAWEAARFPAPDPARVARDVVWYAGRDIRTLDDVWSDARDAVLLSTRGRRCARYVVETAALAPCWAAICEEIRELIGTAGYTQQHHDLLTGPWYSVIADIDALQGYGA